MAGVRREMGRRPQEIVAGRLSGLVRGRGRWCPHASGRRLPFLVQGDQDIQASGAWRGHGEGGRGGLRSISLVRRTDRRAVVTQKMSVRTVPRNVVRLCHLVLPKVYPAIVAHVRDSEVPPFSAHGPSVCVNVIFGLLLPLGPPFQAVFLA